MNVLITGSTGFVGRNLVTWLSKHLDSKSKIITPNLRLEAIFNQDEKFQCDVAVHLAGIAHKNNVTANEYERINCEAAIELAKQLANSGMKRFVFISSIGVNGVHTERKAFNEESPTQPCSAYAQSKLNAENGLKELAKKMNFELVIVRPPLIYGEGAPGNFNKLMKIATSKLPLPFGNIENKRSFISVFNFCQFIEVTLSNPAAANELFLVSDNEHYSTQSLIQMIWKAKKIKSIMVPIPLFILRLILNILGKSNMSIQLLDNLVIDNSKAKKILNWQPKFCFLNTLE